MSMLTAGLKEFANPVPVCSQTSSLATLLEMFSSSGCDAIVVVSEQQTPLGVVTARQVMPHLLSLARLEASPVATRNAIARALPTTGDFHKPISQLEPPIIEPVVILPAQLSLSQFWGYLQESEDRLKRGWGLGEEVSTKINQLSSKFCPTPIPNSQSPMPLTQQWALVDREGKFLGLLNSWLILKFLAPNFTATETAVGAGEQKQPTDLQPLVELLEQLPLPLSLQTATGQVLAQNLTWRQQIGTSPDLHWVRSTTAAMLDSPSVEQRSPNVISNDLKERYEISAQTAVEHYCAIDTPRMAATISQRRVVSSAPPMLKTQENSASWELSAPASETLNKSQERVFSFVKMPLSPSFVKSQSSVVLQQSKVIHPVFRELQERIAFPSTLTPPYGNAPPQQSLPLTSDLCIVLAQDTTEQQQVAKELAAKNADLVQLNQLKDEFLACISHELKTPLTAVVGLSTLLKDQILGPLNERQARYARLIYQSGRQLMTVVNDILDLTRMETGQLELTLEPVQIQSVCDRAYAQALQRPSEKEQQDEESTPETQFTLQIEPGLEMLVADELRLRQMLGHLLSNALKFTDAGGQIGLRVNRWEGWIAFTVWDTGIGIPPEKQHLIFQKFQQLEEPLTRRFEGTGLGLVLTQRLARLHGGDVSFISKTDEGSEFTLLLPPCPPQGSNQEWNVELGSKVESSKVNIQPVNLQPGIQANRNRLVLIVEAVPRYLETLTEQLKSLGYWVVVARSGTEAIEKARSLQPCAILLNPLLPKLSGWDVLTLLKSDAQTLHIPVLVTATQAEKQQAYYNKADGFLNLPVQEKALLQSLTCLGDRKGNTPSSLTILHLSPESIDTHPDASVLTCELTNLLSLQHSELNYRVLEADDLDQAELLAHVWHPDVILLDGSTIADPVAYLKQFSLHTGLTSLPLVTLDHQTTEAANQETGLCVYPCLAQDNSSKITALLQVIQVAAGMSRKASILVMDVSTTEPELEMSKAQCRTRNNTRQKRIQRLNSSDSSPLTPHSSWLHALIQYLETAGFRSLLSCCWSEVFRQLQDQSVDLLLIRVKEISDSSELVKGLISLAQLENLPPILVLDHRLEAPPEDEAIGGVFDSTSELESLLRSVATQILRGHSQPMSQLLDLINHTLTNQR